MLSNEHWLAEYDFAQRRVFPDRLTRFAHAAYLDFAQQMIECYLAGEGRSRQELHRQVHSILADDFDCPPRRSAAFCRILDAQSEFDEGQSVDAARLRKTVFRMAAKHHPLVDQKEGLFASDREAIQRQIAKALDRSWEQIERELFTDIHECHWLLKYTGVTQPEQLLALYNVAQTQATLAQATCVIITTSDLPDELVPALQRLSLAFETKVGQEDQVHIHLSRPAGKRSAVRHYAAALSDLLLSLIDMSDWHLEATVLTKRKSLTFTLRHDEGLRIPIAMRK